MSAYFPLVTPALLSALAAIWILQSLMHARRPGRALIICIGAAAAAASLVPVRGLSAADLILSVNPVFSIGSLAGALMLLWRMLGLRLPLSRGEVTAFAYFGVAFPVLLYASYLGLIGPDIYAMGFTFSIWFVFVGASAAGLFWTGGRLGFVPLAALGAYSLRLLPSDNLFDYLVDVPLMIGCAAYLGSLHMRKTRR